MNASHTFQALRRSNPRAKAGFEQSVDTVAVAVRTQIAVLPVRELHPRRRALGLSAAGASLAAAATVAVFLTVGSPGGGPGVESADAAFKRAATVTAASAERSGTAVVRISHDGKIWAGRTVRWHGQDLALSGDVPRRGPRPGSDFLVVGGMMYGIDFEGRWEVLGSPDSIDPGSGTTPDEYLAAVREDVGGVTLRRMTDAMTGLTTSHLDDGSIVYRGRVPAGLIARETGFKEGEALRVLPFGYVAHDEAADPASLLDTAVTVGADGIFRQITVAWGTWRYTVAYAKLGTTAALVAPANPRRDLLKRLRMH
jgi:hypothetical protein